MIVRYCSNIKLIIITLLVFPQTYAQEITLKNFTLGGEISYKSWDSDLGKYWGNSFSAGPTINYKLSYNYSLESVIALAYLTPKTNQNFDLPNIYLLDLSLGLKYQFPIVERFDIAFTSGLANSTFMFKGKAAEKVAENSIESEMGFFVGVGFNVLFDEEFSIELFTRFLNILSKPSEIGVYSVGIKLVFI